MQLEVKSFSRKTFDVEAVQVTDDNMPEVAKWCGGSIKRTGSGESYVNVPVKQPTNPEKNRNPFRAFPGYWVLKSNTGCRVYTQSGFEAAFVLAHQ